MQDLITSYILQSPECRLRDVGRFKVVTTAARADIANKQLLPPETGIIFTAREEKISDGLVQYIAEKQNLPVSEAQNEVKKWCAEARAKLKRGEEVSLEPLGVLKKGVSGNEFARSKAFPQPFFEPVAAERVIHQESEHAVLVGDKETTLSEMNHYYKEEEIRPAARGWKIIAVVLLAVGLLLLFLHFYKNPFSVKTIGNQQKVVPATAPKTYTTP